MFLLYCLATGILTYLVILIWCIITTALSITRQNWRNPLFSLPGLKFGIRGGLGYLIQFNYRMKELCEMSRAVGRIRRGYDFLGAPRLEISDPDVIKYILCDNPKLYQRRDFTRTPMEAFKRLMGDTSIIIVDGTYHRHIRKLASPAFKPSALKYFLPTFWSTTERLITKWEDICQWKAGSATIQIKDEISNLTLDIIGLTAFGYDFQAVAGKSEFANNFKAISGRNANTNNFVPYIPGVRYIMLLMHFLSQSGWKWTQKIGPIRLFTGMQTVRNHVNKVIEQKKREMQVGMDRPDETSGSDTNGFEKLPDVKKSNIKSLIELILEAQEEGFLSPQEIQDMGVSFIVAGHETSSVTLSFLLLLLSMNPDCQERCRLEAQSVQKTDGFTKGDFSHLVDLKYLQSCILETLRLYPPIPLIGRHLSEEEDENSTVNIGCPIRKNTTVLSYIFEMHRDPMLWDNPDDFKPERFADQDFMGSTKGFMPFGDGPHKCIGYQFALNEVLIIATRLISKFKFEILPGDVFHERSVVTISPDPPLRLKVTIAEEQ